MFSPRLPPSLLVPSLVFSPRLLLPPLVPSRSPLGAFLQVPYGSLPGLFWDQNLFNKALLSAMANHALSLPDPACRSFLGGGEWSRTHAALIAPPAGAIVTTLPETVRTGSCEAAVLS